MKDEAGNEVVFVIYRRKRLSTGGWHRVATFRNEEGANMLLETMGDPQLFVSCETATVRDLSLVRD